MIYEIWPKISCATCKRIISTSSQHSRTHISNTIAPWNMYLKLAINHLIKSFSISICLSISVMCESPLICWIWIARSIDVWYFIFLLSLVKRCHWSVKHRLATDREMLCKVIVCLLIAYRFESVHSKAWPDQYNRYDYMDPSRGWGNPYYEPRAGDFGPGKGNLWTLISIFKQNKTHTKLKDLSKLKS